MADIVELAKVCDLDGRKIPPAVPGGGEYQGGPIEITFGAIVVRLDVCGDCQQNRQITLRQLRELGSTAHGGTVPGIERLAHLPVKD